MIFTLCKIHSHWKFFDKKGHKVGHRQKINSQKVWNIDTFEDDIYMVGNNQTIASLTIRIFVELASSFVSTVKKSRISIVRRVLLISSRQTFSSGKVFGLFKFHPILTIFTEGFHSGNELSASSVAWTERKKWIFCADKGNFVLLCSTKFSEN